MKRLLIFFVCVIFSLSGCATTKLPTDVTTPTPKTTTEITDNPTNEPTPIGKLSEKEKGLKLMPYIPSTKFEKRPGLYVEKGVLMHEGKPYVKLGVNFFGAFCNSFMTANKEFDDIFSLMNEYGIEYCRINFGLFWPNNYKKMDKNYYAYYDTLDEVVLSAEKHNIGLICSLFWHQTGVADYCGEPLSAWGKEDSKTRQFMNDYIDVVVNRYSESPAIWGWEYGNEFNLGLDLPNGMELLPQTIVSQMGTPATRI